ncbi:hypothetical protein AKUG0101_01340 [Apilactobacillus kunkeei]|nr:hypothetical protein AKUG0101_01340 [Apilactobacillus kunkeei]
MQATLFIRPQKVILGGGVISEPVIKKVREQFKEMFNDYVDVGDLDYYITMLACEDNGSLQSVIRISIKTILQRKHR